jgi:peptide/nickel transport system ATP-binding protein
VAVELEETRPPPETPAPAGVAAPTTESRAEVAGPPPETTPPVLEVKDLKTYFFTYDGVVHALEGIHLEVRRGETVGLVGETGCGKSVTAFSITRLIPDPPGRIISGTVRFRGANLLWGLQGEATYRPVRNTPRVRVRRRFGRIRAASDRMGAVRGRGIAMIFQEPTQALNPVFSISNQLGEIVFLHRGIEILDGMLAWTPQAPAVGAALKALLAAAGTHDRTKIRAAADALGAAAHSPTLATEAFYIARGAVSPRVTRLELERAVDRLRLKPLQQRYLRHVRRLAVLRQELHQVYLEEMRAEKSRARSKAANRTRATAQRWSHAYFRLWGLRRWTRRPVDRELFWRVVGILEGVSIANPVQVARGYPHELSGGMLQRVMIAMALSSDPDLLIADEPTTALDVTIQAQILELINALRKRVGTGILLITHDLAVVAEVADRVCVMYAGQIVEEGAVHEIFTQPLHPYTQGLLASVPRVDQPGKELKSIPGAVPNLIEPPTGCRFHPRCPFAMPVCKGEFPAMTEEGPRHRVACYLYHGPRVGG